jgi:hypothetical protein
MIVGAGITIGKGITIINDLTLVSSGLVLYLDAANSSSYSGSGSTWYDLSGNNNNVAMQNSSNISYSSSGGGYFALTSTGYFSAASSTNTPTGNSNYTFSVWAQLGSTWNANGFMSLGSAWGTTNAVNAFRTGSTGQVINYWWSNDLSLIYSPSSATAWINFVVTFDGTNRKIWVNGTSIGGDTPTGHNVTTSYLQVGATNSTGETLNGKIGQALIYNRALSQTEITNNYTVIRGRYGV